MLVADLFPSGPAELRGPVGGTAPIVDSLEFHAGDSDDPRPARSHGWRGRMNNRHGRSLTLAVQLALGACAQGPQAADCDPLFEGR